MGYIEDIAREEAAMLIATLATQITNPNELAAVSQMTSDMAMIPIRMAKGEDVALLIESLRAEAEMRGVATSLRAKTALQQVWANVILRILTTVLLV